MSHCWAIASASLARGSPRCQVCSSRPRVPRGCSLAWSGPAAKPSSEIDMWQVVSDIVLFSFGCDGACCPARPRPEATAVNSDAGYTVQRRLLGAAVDEFAESAESYARDPNRETRRSPDA